MPANLENSAVTVNIRWIIEKEREFQENIYFCFIDYAKAFVWITQTVENSERDRNTRPPDLPPEKSVCKSEATVRNGHGKHTGSKMGKEYIKAVYRHPAN